METITLTELQNVLAISLRGRKVESAAGREVEVSDATSRREFRLRFVPDPERELRGSGVAGVMVNCHDQVSDRLFYHYELNSLKGPVFVSWENKDSVILVHSDGARFYLLAVSHSLGAQMISGREKRTGPNPFSRESGQPGSNQRKRYAMIVP
jgi:hypothetical protein